MIINKILFICCCIIFIQCSNVEITPIPIPKELSVTKKMNYSNRAILDGIQTDSLLIFISQTDIKKIHVHDKISLDFIMSFGEKGNQSAEFNFPIFNKSITNNDSIIRLEDSNLFQFKNININKIIRGGNIWENITYKRFRRDFILAHDLMDIGDGKITVFSYSSSIDTKGPCYILDTITNDKTWIKFQKHNYKNIETTAHAHHNNVLVNSLNKTLVISYLYYDLIQFFDNNGNIIKSLQFSDLEKPKEAERFSGVRSDNNLFFCSSYGTKEHCYFSRKIIEKDKKYYLILKTDWNGNLVESYKINLPMMLFFIVDEFNGKIYSIINDENDFENEELIEWKIN